MQSAISLGFGAHGGPSTRCARIAYVEKSFKCCRKIRSANAHPWAQGYELSEEEVRISLDDFRDKFADVNGAPE